MKPSSSTVASLGLGGAITILIVWALDEFAGVKMPDYVSAAVGVIVSSLVGYVFPGGRADDIG
jgi:hypothetical protein